MRAYIKKIVGDISKEYGIEFLIEEQDDALTFLMSMLDCDSEEITGDSDVQVNVYEHAIEEYFKNWHERNG